MIKQFFNKKETIEIEPIEVDSSRFVLEYLLTLSTSSPRLNSIELDILNMEIQTDPIRNDLSWMALYLKLEEYLLIHDPSYISSERKFREDIAHRFPEFASKDAFGPFKGDALYQEIQLNYFLLTYIIHRLEQYDNSQHIAKKWNFISFPNDISLWDMDRVLYIKTLRKIREHSRGLFIDCYEHIDLEWIDQVYRSCINEFKNVYTSVAGLKNLADLIPASTKATQVQKKESHAPIQKISKKQSTSVALKNIQTDIVGNILDGFILCDHLGKILHINSRAKELFSLTTYIETSIYALLPEETATKLKADLTISDDAFPKQIIGTRSEIEVHDKRKGPQDYELAITNNYSDGLDTISIFIKNITHKKESLKAFQEAKVIAERSAKAKATFLSNMSHEIRTPLNVILGLSEIVKKTDYGGDSMFRKNIDGIDFSAKSLLSIVNDILDFSKIEAGKLSLQSLDFNICKLAESVYNGFQLKAQEQGITFTSSIDPAIPNIVIGDQYRLNQVLTNLIGNALKFTPTGEISLAISLAKENENEVLVRFEVKDSGIGIPKDKLERIFESFYQVEHTKNAKIRGTGLGLAITQQLINLMKGTLVAESMEGLGSTFTFEVPFGKSAIKTLRNNSTNTSNNNQSVAGLRVLVAEDNKMNQFYVEQLLKNLKVETIIAENGKIALEKYNETGAHYDLILMDMHMPVMGGIDAITSIRNTAKHNKFKTPIVMCSADVFPEARKEAIKAGIDFYLTKPVKQDALKEVLFWLKDETKISESITSVSEKNLAQFGQHIDMAHLSDTFDNDTEFILSLLEVFIQETPTHYNSLHNCLEQEYYMRAAKIAHKMKSSFMNLGLSTHGHHLLQIENSINQNGEVQEAIKHFNIFKKLYTKTLLDINIAIIELKKQRLESSKLPIKEKLI